jgi:hypothetical protein
MDEICTVHGEMKNSYKTEVRKLQRNKSLGRSRRRRKNSIM